MGRFAMVPGQDVRHLLPARARAGHARRPEKSERPGHPHARERRDLAAEQYPRHDFFHRGNHRIPQRQHHARTRHVDFDRHAGRRRHGTQPAALSQGGRCRRSRNRRHRHSAQSRGRGRACLIDSAMNLDVYRRILAGESLTASLSPRASWRLTGTDALRYLNGQVTNDVARLADGEACYAAVCTAKGRMEGDVSIALHAGEFYLDADPALREGLGARLEKYLIADDAVLEDVSDLWSLRPVFGATPPPAPEAGFVIAYARFGLPGPDVSVV